jgi:hypothetical protein
MKYYLTVAMIFLSFQGFTQSQFNPYVPQMPINEMAQVGMYKQQLYDSRRDFIQKNVTVIATNIDAFSIGPHLNTELVLKELEDKPGTYRSNGIVERLEKKHRTILKNYLSSIGSIDFTNDYSFKNIMDRLKLINEDVLDDLSPLLKPE